MQLERFQLGPLLLGRLEVANEDTSSLHKSLAHSEILAAQKFKHALRKTEFLAGRAILRSLEPKLPPVLTTDSGMPVWDGEFTGSISHKKGWVLACVSSSKVFRSIGIDIEDWSQFPNEISRIICHPEEMFINPRFENEAQHLSLIFSCKESLFKVCYPLCKIWFGFHDAQMLSYENGVFEIQLLKTLSEEFQAGHKFQGHYKQVHWGSETFVVTGLAVI